MRKELGAGGRFEIFWTLLKRSGELRFATLRIVTGDGKLMFAKGA